MRRTFPGWHWSNINRKLGRQGFVFRGHLEPETGAKIYEEALGSRRLYLLGEVLMDAAALAKARR